MKPHRIKMTYVESHGSIDRSIDINFLMMDWNRHNLLLNYDLYKKMEIYVSDYCYYYFECVLMVLIMM